MEHDHMVQALAPKGTNDSLYIRPLPRRSRCGQNFLDAHVCDLPLEFLPEDGVAIAQQVARDLLEGATLRYTPLRKLLIPRPASILSRDNSRPRARERSF